MSEIKLTEFSPGAGCGCKISPSDLKEILKSDLNKYFDENLLVGNENNDDAAVYDIGNDICIISTTDFFTPIVDDAFNFGRIAATNAISDIYAMGGKPIMAIAILGWPLEKLSKHEASKVIEGARNVCVNAKISLAGGHSIDIHDPIFGLAVTGIINKKNIKTNSGAKIYDKLFITKPLGIGILTTAEKKKLIKSEDKNSAIEQMLKLNSIGEIFSDIDGVNSMTDITGFGLLGHLIEMCEGSCVSAIIDFNNIPTLPNIKYYIENKSIPGGTHRNWKSYGDKVNLSDESQKFILCDPQTSGGLLVSISESSIKEFLSVSKENNCEVFEIGRMVERKDKIVEII